MFTTVCSAAVYGLQAYLVRVEVDLAGGLPSFQLVGSLGSEVKESRERVSVAMKNSGFQIPPAHITVNLAPAGRRKDGTAFDLPVAVGLLRDMELVPEEAGGGSGIPRPGMVSLAHRGVLFLDELPEFRKNVLDGMRQPMEERKVQIARSAGMVTYPSDFILVAAMNPCPCGYYPDRNKCRCTQPQIEKYLGKISGPILDRIDLCVELHPVDILHLQKTKTEKSSEDMKRQIRHARERQAERFAGTDCRFNGDIRSAQVEEYCPLGEEGQKVMEQLYRTLQLSARVYHRILKTARTIADLEDREEITGEHLLEAACYRPSETYWN